jgi:hypothetical protein
MATGALYSAFLVNEEGTASSLRGVREVVAQHGCSARSTPIVAATTSRRRKRAGVEDGADAIRPRLTQLGIEHIAAYSPQARGRSERVFGTLQDRLPKEFALAGISTVEAANRWLREVYISAHNEQPRPHL